jgi:hypothetical protein
MDRKICITATVNPAPTSQDIRKAGVAIVRAEIALTIIIAMEVVGLSVVTGMGMSITCSITQEAAKIIVMATIIATAATMAVAMTVATGTRILVPIIIKILVNNMTTSTEA